MEEEDATDQRPHSSITEKAQWKQMWIRKEPDKDGYFLLQLLWKRNDYNHLFLTAEDPSSLTIVCK